MAIHCERKRQQPLRSRGLTATRMRILLLSTSFPDDPRRKVHGVYQRLGMLVEALKELGRLDVMFLVEPRIDTSAESIETYRRRLAEHWGVDLDLELVSRERPPERITRWDIYGPGMIDGFRNWSFRWGSGRRQRAALEAALRRSPDVIFVHRLAAMAPVLQTAVQLPPVFFDLDDVEHIAFARSIRQPPTWTARRLLYLQVPALWWSERRAIKLSHRTFVCSSRDQRYLTRTMRVSGVTVIPNAVEARELQPPSSRPTALFIGSLDYGPNRNAAALLVREIWPRVRRLLPDARLTIAGPHPERVPGYAEAHPGIEFPDFVEDLDALYADTRVVCVPILSGGGTRIKLLEAAAFGKAIVATPVGAEGLDMQDGEHFLERSNVDAFAQAVAELLRDDAKCARLGRAAYELVRTRYSRDGVLRRIRQEIASSMD